jgi:hypothetical protein
LSQAKTTYLVKSTKKSTPSGAHKWLPATRAKKTSLWSPDIDARVKELLELVRKKYVSTVGEEAKVMDLGKKIQYFTLDVISTVGFGQPFGDLKADADLNDYIKSDEEGLSILKFCLALGLIPIMQWPPIARLLGPGPKGT